MKMAFVDTLYFVALFNPRDQWHERAIAASTYSTLLKTDLRGWWIPLAIIVVLLIAIIGALIWRLYNKLPPDLRNKK